MYNFDLYDFSAKVFYRQKNNNFTFKLASMYF